MAQLGHADPKFTLRIYAHQMRRGEDERARLTALVEGTIGHWKPKPGTEGKEHHRPRQRRKPRNHGASGR
ncbi:MAG: hypothetical protein ACXVSX_08045 [Solirubrobacteraceae bacterium]